MTEYKIGRAIVRVHGKPDQAKLKEAAERFMKKVLIHRRKSNEKRD